MNDPKLHEEVAGRAAAPEASGDRADEPEEQDRHQERPQLGLPLPQGDPLTLPQGAEDWIETRSVTALMVLKDGQIRHESYRRGTGPTDLRISWSVAKSYLSALFGILLEEGAIASIDDPVIMAVVLDP